MPESRTVLASAGAALLFTWLTPRAAHADTILNLLGRVRLADAQSPSGTKVGLEVDLDRNGVFEAFEMISATVDAAGNFNVAYVLDPSRVDLKFVTVVADLLTKYRGGGFDALVSSGPLPMAVTFEREGYSTLTRRLSTMLSTPSLDAMLAPLAKVGCAASGCQSADGQVALSGFPGGTGITHAYAKAYDPRIDRDKFAGSFADSTDNLLVSSGFTEIDLRDASGSKVHTLSSPVAVKYRLAPSSWPTIVDLTPGTGKIEVPMYSFDESSAQWVSEANGELQTSDGNPIAESSLTAITGGTFSGDVVVSFQARHFSSWNVDRPIQTHTCVKGRLVDQSATAIAGLRVYAEGVSYTGTSGSITTGADGFFVAEIMKSELPGEDIDGNGKTGETATVKLQVSGTGGVFTSTAFASPTAPHSVGSYGSPACQPASCDCVALPDTQVSIQPPRACALTVVAKYSGKSSSGTSPLATGSAVVGASITGELAESASGIVGSSDSICQNAKCNSGTADAAGSTVFVIPVVGDAPKIKLSATLEQPSGSDFHYYTGTAVIDGCLAGRTQVVQPVQLDLDHVQLSAVASFISALGAGPPPSGTGSSSPRPPGCAASSAGDSSHAGILVGALLGVGAVLRRRRSAAARGDR